MTDTKTDNSATDNRIITRASKQTIDRLVEQCTKAQQIWLEETEKAILESGHEMMYLRLTGKEMPSVEVERYAPEELAQEQAQEQKQAQEKVRLNFIPESDIPQRFTLPNTKDIDDQESGRIYEQRAADYAADILINYFASYEDASLDAYIKGADILKEAFKRDPDSLGLLESWIDAGKLNLSKDDAKGLERSFNKTLDEIVEAMRSLDEKEPIPFFMDILFDDGEDYTIVPEVRQVKRVYLDALTKENTGMTPLIVDAPAIPEKKLGSESVEYLSDIARQALDKVVSLVIAPNMKTMDHPKFNECFIEQPDRQGAYWLTEQGAELLEGLITQTASQATIISLHTRLMIADNFDGFRLRMLYKVLPDDKIMMQPVIEYLCPQHNRITFNIPKMDIDIEDENSIEKLRSFYQDRIARDILTRTIAYNMDATSHPAIGSYFTTSENRQPAMTEKGRQIFGEQIDTMSETLAQEMMDLPDNAAGGKYILEYTLNNKGIEHAHISKIIR
ncbi:MAG: hypothetical protein V1729_02005 [Candidatus Woesearchaeota archaeon]